MTDRQPTLHRSTVSNTLILHAVTWDACPKMALIGACVLTNFGVGNSAIHAYQERKPLVFNFNLSAERPSKTGPASENHNRVDPKEQERLRLRSSIRGSLQSELWTISRLIDLSEAQATTLLHKINEEWEAKITVPISSNTFRGRTPVREALTENAMQVWLKDVLTQEQLEKYTTELDLRGRFRIAVLQEQLLSVMQVRFSFTEAQIIEFRRRLQAMQPLKDREMSIRQLTESAQHRLVAPLVNVAYSEGIITSAQRNAVARNELGTLQAKYPESAPRIRESIPFKLALRSDDEWDFYTAEGLLASINLDHSPPQDSEEEQVLINIFSRERNFSQAATPAIKNANVGNPNFVAGSLHGRLQKYELEEMLYGVVGGSRQAFQYRRKDDIQRKSDRIQAVCQLTDEQKDKASQAAEIEIDRNVSEIAALLSEINDESTPEQKQKVYGQAHRELTRMQNENYFEKTGLWEKVIHSNLTPEQLELLRLENSRTAERESEVRRLTVVLDCQQRLGLLEMERHQLLTFLERPENKNIQFVHECRTALAELNANERRKVLPDLVWRQW